MKSWIGLIFLLMFSNGWAASELKEAKNLQQTGIAANERKIPIALFLVYEGLKSGQILRDDVIVPALLSGEYDGKVLFREVRVNRDEKIIDFYGEPMALKEFRSLYNITSLPAMVFVDGEGEPLVSPLFAGSYDYYEYYLKQKLNEALKQLKSPQVIE